MLPSASHQSVSYTYPQQFYTILDLKVLKIKQLKTIKKKVFR